MKKLLCLFACLLISGYFYDANAQGSIGNLPMLSLLGDDIDGDDLLLVEQEMGSSVDAYRGSIRVYCRKSPNGTWDWCIDFGNNANYDLISNTYSLYSPTHGAWNILNDVGQSGNDFFDIGYAPADPGGAAVWQSRIRLDQGGHCGIGTTVPDFPLHVAGLVGAQDFITLSDRRFKDDIKNLNNSLDKISRLQGVSYTFKQAEFPDKKFDDRRHIGFIAQNVREVFPEAVYEDRNGYLAVAYQNIIPALTEAVKELNTENKNLRSENENLQTQMEQMQNRLAAIEALLNNANKNNHTVATAPSALQVVPNPSQNTHRLIYEVGSNGQVTIDLLNSNGQVLQNILRADRTNGNYEENVSVQQLLNGTYYYRISDASGTRTVSFVVAR